MTSRYDVVGVGNAIVDVLASVTDEWLYAHSVEKGAMTLIDEARAEALYSAFPPALEKSGGSGANTLAGVASFGGRAAYIGKVADDQLGAVFAHDIRAGGVAYDTAPVSGGTSTARCLIAVTGDGQRSMNTFLGVSTEFSEADLDRAMIEAGEVLYLEGYLFDRAEAKAAFVAAAEIARAAGKRVAITLSDHFCVERHKESFRHLVRGHADLVFANEAELMALYDTDDFAEAVRAVRGDAAIAAVTRSEKGSVVVAGDEVHKLPALAVEKVLDTTGAGDQYAAGFLYGWSRGKPLATCAALGHLAAAEVIAHFGARPETPYSELARKAGLG